MRVLVTGASGGIGKECVRQLLKVEDCQVIAVSRSGDILEKLKGECLKETGKVPYIIESDFHEEGFQKFIKEALVKHFGGLDGLINNAGSLSKKDFTQVNRLDIQEQMRINFEAPFLLTQALIPLLKKKEGSSHVVNIGSMGGFQGSKKFPGLSVYSASKGALAILTESLATEFEKENIRFNCLALGSADTEMLRKAFPGYQSPTTASEMAKFIADFTLNGHRYFNGKIIPVAGLST